MVEVEVRMGMRCRFGDGGGGLVFDQIYRVPLWVRWYLLLDSLEILLCDRFSFVSFVTRIASIGRLKGVLRGISQALIEGILHSMASVLLFFVALGGLLAF
jgi:hypothetical protein